MDVSGEKQLRETLLRIEDYLPGWAEFVEAEYRVNSEFQALCDDFLVCARAKDKWERDESPIASERRREYAEWLQELLLEVKDWLQHSANTSKVV